VDGDGDGDGRGLSTVDELPMATRQRSMGVEMGTHTRQRSGVRLGGIGIAAVGGGAGPGALSMVEEHGAAGDSRKELFERGCDILYEYAFEMDPLRVLQLLPASMDVTFLEEYIRKIIPYLVHKRRIKQISKNLQKRVYLRQRTELAKVRSQFIKMDYGSLCAKCNKRIGRSVFILQPHSLRKFHYSCFYRKRQPQNPNLMAEYTDDSQPAGRSEDESEMKESVHSASYQHPERPSNERSPRQQHSENLNPFGASMGTRSVVDSTMSSMAHSLNTTASNNPFDSGGGGGNLRGNGNVHHNPFANDSVLGDGGNNPFSNSMGSSKVPPANSGSSNPFGNDMGNDHGPSSSYNPFGSSGVGNSRSANGSNLERGHKINRNNPFQSDSSNAQSTNPFL